MNTSFPYRHTMYKLQGRYFTYVYVFIIVLQLRTDSLRTIIQKIKDRKLEMRKMLFLFPQLRDRRKGEQKEAF